jgi:hypothetical protein
MVKLDGSIEVGNTDNSDITVLSIFSIKDGGTEVEENQNSYETFDNDKGYPISISAILELSAGDQVIFYLSSPLKAVTANIGTTASIYKLGGPIGPTGPNISIPVVFFQGPPGPAGSVSTTIEGANGIDNAESVTDFNLSITPSLTTSKILILCSIDASVLISIGNLVLYRTIDGTTSRITRSVATINTSTVIQLSFSYIDVPGTTSSISYDLRAYNTGPDSTIILNQRSQGSLQLIELL